ncbi:adenylate/guanylate cyclase domain-containing protein, partial [Pseudomonadota bacterium]
VVNFTMKSESLDPDDLTYIVNSYLNRMAEVAVMHGGTLDKFIGDGVLIFFGDPESRGVQDDACACVSMALDMLTEVENLNKAALKHGVDSPLEIRIGIATGYCTVGNFGSESRMDYTVLGKTVNLAARLEASAPSQGILVSSETELLVSEKFNTAPTESITVKGFEKPVPVYRVEKRR